MLLTFAAAALLWGCGDDDEDASTAADTTTTTTATTTEAPPKDSPKPDKAPSSAEVDEARAGYQACLKRQGLRPGSLPSPKGDSSIDEGLQKKLLKLRRAVAACIDKLPKNAELGAASELDLDKLRGEATAGFRRVEEFRACMGRHGYGPEAGSTEPTGDLRKAFSDCRDEAAAGQ